MRLQAHFDFEVKSYVMALAVSLDERGFLSQPLERVAENFTSGGNQVLSLNELEAVLKVIQEESNLLGIGSRDYKEIKWVMASYFKCHTDPELMTGEFNPLVQWIEETELLGFENTLAKLEHLAESFLNHQSRKIRLTEGIVKTLVDCCEKEAKVLLEGYFKLPSQPVYVGDEGPGI